MKREFIKVITFCFLCIFVLPGFQELKNIKIEGNFLRRLIEVPSLNEKIKSKLELVKLCLGNVRINQAKQIFKDNPEELNELALKIGEPRIARELELSAEEIQHLQDILRNYELYSSKEIKKETGFSKSMFPALLHLWIEEGPFYKGRINIFLGRHIDEKDFESLRPALERVIQEAREKEAELVYIVEFGSIGLKAVEQLADSLRVDVLELLQKKRYRENLRQMLTLSRRNVEEMYRGTEEGILPSEENLTGISEFSRAEMEFLAKHRIKTVVEALSVEAMIEGILGELRFNQATQALFQGNLEEYIEKRWQSLMHLAENLKLRDRDFQAQVESLGRPNRYILSIRGAMHQLGSKNEIGYEIREVRIFESLPTPGNKLLQMLIEGGEISESQKRKLLLEDIVSMVSATLLLRYSPSIRVDEIEKIGGVVAEKWSEEEILQLVDRFSISKQEGFTYFLEWLKGSDLPPEIKALFPSSP